jgi:hypothetical protein
MYYILLLTHKNNLKKVKDKYWLKEVNLPYIILYGDESIEHDYHYNKDENTLIVKCPDTYEYITLKLACAYKAILNISETSNITGIFKIDDDVVVNLKELYNYIDTFDKNDYVGHAHRTNKTICSHHQSKVSNNLLKNLTFTLQALDFCYGPMYFLSKKALQNIVGKFSYHNFSIYSTDIFEDYTFANLLKKSDIYPKCIKMYTDHLDQFTKYNFISFHDIDHTKDILDIDKSININLII